MKWVAKVAAQHVLGWTPGATRLEEIARSRVTRTRAMDAELFRFRLRWGPLNYVRSAADHFGVDRFPDLFHYDVGAGWQPIVPFLLHSAGVGRQRLMDVERHLSLDGCRQVAEAMDVHRDYISEALPGISLTPPSEALERWQPQREDSELDALLRPMGMEYVVPEEITASPLPDSSIDLLTCTGVLAYLPPEVLEATFREFRRLLKPDGLLGLYVHLVDDFATFDRSLPSFHFLRYEDWFWDKLICSRRFYSNRLRQGDYEDLFRRHGFATVSLDSEPPTSADLKALSEMTLAERFRDKPLAQLGIRRFRAVLRP